MSEHQIKQITTVELPPFSDTRIMMMPFHWHDPVGSLPELNGWRNTIVQILNYAPRVNDIGYITIDEYVIEAGLTQRRPGLHMDGTGAWGGPAPYAACGMYLVSSMIGCRGWNQIVPANPGIDGDCEHMRPHLDPACEILMQANQVYWCSPTAVHEALPMVETTARQLLRISMPSSAPHHVPYTLNPCGVEPATSPGERRDIQMSYRN